MSEAALDRLLRTAAARPGRLVVLTGAGISAESGIPTFRGPDGWWTVGSRHHRPEEMATRAFFERHPEEVWAWYLHRRALCAAALPNAAHHALVRLERGLGDRFRLVTQNVDGLHQAAGSSPERTWPVHGCLHAMRCAGRCPGTRPLPAMEAPDRGAPLGPDAAAALRCPCGAWMRPHVLWFDETYDEENFHYDSALGAASEAALLLVIGTTGTTTLPMRMAAAALSNGVPLVDVDPQDNVFAALAQSPGRRGVFVEGTATACVPPLVRRLLAMFTPGGATGLRPGDTSP